ncbi:TIGR03546 family protein [Bdellovibrionales bacterium]|nr:TIGR03546 family protein [Bdellovibrionales bacterium]
MGLILKQLFGFIKLLNSETGSNQISAGLAAGFILGMTPSLSLQTVLVFVVIFLFRVQLGAAMLAAFFFAFPAYLLDPIFSSAGRSILQAEGLQSLFTTMYNMPIVPFTRFNNSVVMGSGVISILLSPLVFLLARFLVKKYRETVLKRLQETKFWKAIKATSLYKWYYKYDELYG